MEKEKLFTQSLTEEDEKVDIYDIRKFFYVAFFGGVVPLLGLATKTARQLKINNKIIAILAAVGVLLLLGKYIVAFTIYNNQPIMDMTTIRRVYKVASCLLYLGYYKIMKERFIINITYGSRIKPMLKDAVIWIFIGILVEGVFAYAAVRLAIVI